MRKLLLLGTMMVPLLTGPAKADLVWQVHGLDNILSDNGNLFSIDGSFTTDDTGSVALASALTLTTPDQLAGTGDFNTADGAVNSAGNYPDVLLSDSVEFDSIRFTFSSSPDGSVDPDPFSLIEITWFDSSMAGHDDSLIGAGYATVPEPMSLAILAVGMAGMLYVRRRPFA